MLASISAAILNGAVGQPVSVEVHVSNGLPGFTIVGLPDAAVRESRDRVWAALLSSGLPWPLRLITVNLAPSRYRFGKLMAHVWAAQGRRATGCGRITRVFYHDCSPEIAAWACAMLTRQPLAPMLEPISVPRLWKADVRRASSSVARTERVAMPRQP